MTASMAEIPADDIDPIELRRACSAFATGVTVVSTRQAGADFGMTANAFMSVSLSPPLIVVSIARRARMLARIEASRRYGVSVLAEDMQALADHFAGKPQDGLGEIFEDFGGLPVIRGALAHFAARLYQAVDAGDHVLFIGRVEKLAHRARRPLIFQRGAFQCLPI